nr:hypothetical protein [Deltaproteobacteria bacterium]
MHELSSSAAAPPTFPSEPPRSDASGDRPLLEDIDLPAAILDESGTVWDVNEAWRTSPVHVATVGQRYLDGLRSLSPSDADALSQSLDSAFEASGDVRERTVACHNNDSEHWLNVSISTVTLGGRRASLVLHQDATALRQMERRQRLSRSIASALVMPLDPALRVARLAVTIGEALQSSAVVLWERAPSGVLRARPLETSCNSPQVATIAHTRQLIGVMDGHAAHWFRLVDGTACLAVPVEAHGQVVIFHFAHRPRFDAETLRLVSHALRPSALHRELTNARRGRSPREIRRQLSHDENAASPSLALQERQHIERTLERCGYNLLRTAQALGIARSTLYERIKDYGIKVPTRSA